MLQDNKHKLLSRSSPSAERQARGGVAWRGGPALSPTRGRGCGSRGGGGSAGRAHGHFALATLQANAKQIGLLHAKFPSGLIRGALHGLGVGASVAVEVVEVDKCQFTIKIQNSEGKP